jgi:ABC-2 type transport system permease protein
MSSFFSVTGAVAWRMIHKFTTNPSFLLPSIIFPLFFFTAFAGGLSSVAEVPGFDFPAGYTAFQFVFVLIQSAAFGGVFTGFSIAADFENGFARRLLLGAPNRYGILAGYAVAAFTRAVIVGTLLFVVALVVGMQVGGDGVDVVALILLALLVNMVGAFFAAGVAMRIRTIQAGPAMQMPIFLLLFLAPVYVPLDLVGGWVHSVAVVNPLTPLLETGRDLIAGTPPELLAAYGIALGLVLVMLVWAIGGLKSAERAGGG